MPPKHLEDSGDFRMMDACETSSNERLIGQLLEAVNGLRRDQKAQTALIRALASEVDQFKTIAQSGRGILIGMGLASLGVGAIAHKIVEMLWPS